MVLEMGKIWYNISMFRRLRADKGVSRSIDGMRETGAPEGGGVILDANDLPWMTNKGDEGQRQVAEARRRMEALQDKIIAFFSIDEKSLVSADEIVSLGARGLRDLKRKRLAELRKMVLTSEDPEVTEKQRREFLRRLKQNEIRVADEASFLLLIRDPLNNPQVGVGKMFDRIASDPRQIQILAVATGYNLRNWQKVDKEALRRLLGAVQADGSDYRTPVGFQKLRKHFLDGIRAKTREQVFRCYERSMDELEYTLYGKRLEYYRAFEKLRAVAEDRMNEVEPIEDLGGESAAKAEPTREAREKFERILTERGGGMLGQAVIDGDAWRGDGRMEMLGTHDLAEMKLSPMYEVEVSGMKIALSPLYRMADGQVATVAYVPEGSGYRVRSFYRHNGLGLWCYLPDYVRGIDGGISGLGSGYETASVILPIELQMALMQIEEKFGTINVARPELVFAGAAKAYDSAQDYQAAYAQGKMRGDYYREVAREAMNRDFGADDGRKKAPYTLGIDYRRSPDFGQPRARFVTNTVDAGEVKAEAFSSHDGQLVWLFFSDGKGRTWVGQVEAVGPMTSLGLRQDYVAMGDFMTPLYEYSTKAGIYGDRSDTRGPRQCMWKNYLSNVPLIQEYIAQRD